ncbi:hypothetical protein ACRQFI_08290 [Actinotignum sp. GS-2025e]|uniref:hypothetical protein n=1 Tax=Actinotignum sp. GS-2025e TaxID=3427278 RepID=UPI003F47296E
MNKLNKWNVPAGWEEALCDWGKTQTLAGHRESSRAYRTATLRSFARTVDKPPNEVTEQDIIDWASGKEIAPETRHGRHRKPYMKTRSTARLPEPSSSSASQVRSD